ncbi:MAG: rhamnulokinase [Verrucomicrobiae bacterium]|nr:rhamnulokinase [Verrucomicrobiae bacterium]
MQTHHLACDLGAESGRLMLGTLENGKLRVFELHRFPNGPVQSGVSLHWDIHKLFSHIEDGLRMASKCNTSVSSISTDSWGVDYLLYDEQGRIIEPTFHYRDSRCQLGVKNALSKVPWNELFAETGLQFLQFNTVFQLAAETPERLNRARLILGIGDGFNYWLSGVARFEESLASTTQLYNPRTRSWSQKVLAALNLPRAIFPEIVPSGTRLGPLRPDLAQATGLKGVEVVASCSHDTGAAVAAVPAEGEDWAYLSSGTWSLMGVELLTPVINDTCLSLNFTNEIGFGGSVRLLKNIIGLWLVQECRREWVRQGLDYDYSTLTDLAAKADPFVSLINPADTRFISPGDMPGKIAAFCREHHQPIPGSPGAYVRCALESLALLYKRTLMQIQQLTGREIKRLHIVGGGSKNALLNQFAANATQVPVYTGPVEATATGNILVQAIALGKVASLAEARSIVRKSVEMGVVYPTDKEAWDNAYRRFEDLISASG